MLEIHLLILGLLLYLALKHEYNAVKIDHSEPTIKGLATRSALALMHFAIKLNLLFAVFSLLALSTQ